MPWKETFESIKSACQRPVKSAAGEDEDDRVRYELAIFTPESGRPPLVLKGGEFGWAANATPKLAEALYVLRKMLPDLLGSLVIKETGDDDKSLQSEVLIREVKTSNTLVSLVLFERDDSKIIENPQWQVMIPGSSFELDADTPVPIGRADLNAPMDDLSVVSCIFMHETACLLHAAEDGELLPLEDGYVPNDAKGTTVLALKEHHNSGRVAASLKFFD
jgi:hypothetical protein